MQVVLKPVLVPVPIPHPKLWKKGAAGIVAAVAKAVVENSGDLAVVAVGSNSTKTSSDDNDDDDDDENAGLAVKTPIAAPTAPAAQIFATPSVRICSITELT
jgi:hypothetical protein